MHSCLSATAPLIAELPSELPVMVLADCYLLPGCMLPLFIFEDRYRRMLASALESDRMFCIGTRCGLESQAGSDVVQVSCAGVIRACVQQDDGTSHLMLMGLHRVRFVGWKTHTPYCIAKVEPILSVRGDEATLNALRDQAMALLPQPSGSNNCAAKALLLEKLQHAADPEIICDVITYNFVHRPSLLRASLAEASVVRRYELLITELKRLHSIK